jgi:RNA recognition motif-containing protein
VLLSRVVEGYNFKLTNSFQRRFTVCMSDVEESKIKVHQLFISNIPFEVDESLLNSLVIDKSGKTFASIKLARDKKTGRSRGFGYIDYDNEADASNAVSSLQGLEVDGRALRVSVAEPRPERPAKTPQENSVFIGNLDFSVSEGEILDMCNDILGPGSVTRVRLVTDRETGMFICKIRVLEYQFFMI